MGKGKTAIVLSAINDLIDRCEINSALVVAPLRVMHDVWPTEIKKWKQFNQLSYSILHGPNKKVKSHYDIYLINYEGLTWLKDYIDSLAKQIRTIPEESLFFLSYASNRKGIKACVNRILKRKNSAYDIFFAADTARLEAKKQGHMQPFYIEIASTIQRLDFNLRSKIPFDCIVFDEITKLKHSNTKRFRAWREVMSLFRYRYGMTGTPASNGYQDLYGQFFMLDNGKRLGANISSFRNTYMRPIPHVDYQAFELLPGAEEKIQEKIQDIIFEVDPKDYVNEAPIINDIKIKLPKSARKIYDSMLKEFYTELEQHGIEALNTSARAIKLLQIANGAVYDDERNVIEIHDAKLQALEEVVEEAAGNPVLIAYSFIHDVNRIKRRFPQTKTLDDKDAIERWNNKEIKMLALHPASAGHGLNLQFGGNILCWFGLPATRNLEHYQQTNARLVGRHGQEKQVYIHRLLAGNTIDFIVRATLENKNIQQQKLIEMIYAIHTDTVFKYSESTVHKYSNPASVY